MKRILACLILLGLGACAVGNKHDYDSGIPQLVVQSSATVAVAVADRRPYTLNKDKTENFVGLSRGGFGNPFDITTVSGNALATDFSKTIISALKSKGIDAREIAVPLGQAGASTQQALIALGRDRSLLLLINDWKSDTYMGTALIYDLRLTVFDKAGRVLAEDALIGRDDLGGSAFNPPAHAKEAVPPAFRAKLEQILNNPKIVAALK